MPDMTEFDQESYGAGYTKAEQDIAEFGFKSAQEVSDRYGKPKGSLFWHITGYQTCVQAWKEGVRL